ncbi:MAG: HDOD domain-containing protein [Gammaproteobacteria bacterium]|nr:HDOD domain-containing protein [Gammaproteobacteria bacterium]
MMLMIAVAGVGLLVAIIGVALYQRPASKPARPASPPPRPTRAVAVDTGALERQPPPPAKDEAPSAPLEMPPALADFMLIGEADISLEMQAQLQASLNNISLPHRSLRDLMSPDFLESGASKKLSELILREPMLAARLLARVNSSFYGLQSAIVSVPHAITFLGISAVRNLSLRFMAEDSFKAETPEMQALFANVWDAGMIASELCVLLAQKLGWKETATSSARTVLSFLGCIATMTLLSQESATRAWRSGLLVQTEIEQEELGLNSMIVGGVLMRLWGLPQSIIDDVNATQRILVTPVQEIQRSDRARLALCYLSSRVGQRIALGAIHEARDINLGASTKAEDYHLHGYLGLPELARIHEHLAAPDIGLAIARMISSVNPADAPASA